MPLAAVVRAMCSPVAQEFAAVAGFVRRCPAAGGGVGDRFDSPDLPVNDRNRDVPSAMVPLAPTLRVDPVPLTGRGRPTTALGCSRLMWLAMVAVARRIGRRDDFGVVWAGDGCGR